jgi:hypothetical protein
MKVFSGIANSLDVERGCPRAIAAPIAKDQAAAGGQYKIVIARKVVARISTTTFTFHFCLLSEFAIEKIVMGYAACTAASLGSGPRCLASFCKNSSRCLTGTALAACCTSRNCRSVKPIGIVI